MTFMIHKKISNSNIPETKERIGYAPASNHSDFRPNSNTMPASMSENQQVPAVATPESSQAVIEIPPPETISQQAPAVVPASSTQRPKIDFCANKSLFSFSSRH